MSVLTPLKTTTARGLFFTPLKERKTRAQRGQGANLRTPSSFTLESLGQRHRRLPASASHPWSMRTEEPENGERNNSSWEEAALVRGRFRTRRTTNTCPPQEEKSPVSTKSQSVGSLSLNPIFPNGPRYAGCPSPDLSCLDSQLVSLRGVVSLRVGWECLRHVHFSGA